MSKINFISAVLMGKIGKIGKDIADVRKSAAAGAPTKVALVSQMTEPDENYLYIGNETGYTSGHVYYFVDGNLTDGGAYGGVNIDNTLSVSGQAADAKKTGDEIAAVKEDLSAFKDGMTANGLVDKASGEIVNYYIALENGALKSSGVTVKTLLLQCNPCEIYRIKHPKSTRFVVASYATEPSVGTASINLYDGRNETATLFTTGKVASWIGIYYYSSTGSNSLTEEETYDVLTVEKLSAVSSFTNIAPECYTVNSALVLPTTFEEIITLYDGLVTARPDLVAKNALTSGDLTNYEYVFSTGNYNKYTGARRDPDPAITKPTILLTSGVHGYERSAVVSLYLLMRDLCNNNYALTDLLNYVNIRIIPVGCPWGYTHNSRLNANGVNINRNFATSAWGDTDPGTPGSADYAGPSAGSEDETKIIQNWMQAHSNALFYTDFHNSNFINEVVTLGGPDTEECVLFKKQFLLAINRVIPYWQKERGIGSNDNMYCYAGGSGTIEDRHSRNYAYEIGIHKAFYCETSWNINGTGKHSIETFLVGAEAMGNFLVGMKKYYEEI